MLKTAKEYRRQSFLALDGKWLPAVAISFIFVLILGAISTTFVGGLVLTCAFQIGMCTVMMNLYRKNTMEIRDLFSGFEGKKFVASIILNILTTIFIALWSLLFVIPGIIAAYRYAMAPYILSDHPEMSGDAALAASKKLMKGRKWNLFCLDLSYIGWILLCILTFGILTLWINPWMMAAKAAFYEDIKKEVLSEATVIE